jgi:hypothetical protein
VALLASSAAAGPIDLTRAVVVTPAHLSKAEEKAVELLIDEVAGRTQVRWQRRTTWPAEETPVIAVGQRGAIGEIAGRYEKQLADPEATRPEGYRILTDEQRPAVLIAGADARGVLFGIGCFLRKAEMSRQKIMLPAALDLATAPEKPLRGHQLGYRPKPNSYDGWNVAQWEQYIRDLAVFGCNAIELVPPRSDDAADSPHFPLPQIEMMVEMSRLADDYGLDVWIWYPAMDKDYADPQTVEFALSEWGDVFRRLPRIDAVFVPGGDPGHTQPKHLLALLEKQTANLKRSHPRAQMWVSPQSFTRPWMDEFLELLRGEPQWLTGIVYGPQVRMPLNELRSSVPERYPIRDYPDITHSRHCQYPVPDWDLAFAVTEGREIINPRPTQMAQIYRVTTQPHAQGFITYSEGCNDDVNKAVWSALGWSSAVDVEEVITDYSRYFIGPRSCRDFAEGLFALERNWQGPILGNHEIERTLSKFQSLEKKATPHEKKNWRFQQALYRAYYDAYVRRRLTHETELEQQALQSLATAGTTGSLAAIGRADEALNSREVADETAALRARLFELAEALFQSIHMQLSVPRYAGMSGRGNNLDDLDQPLNNRPWLLRRLDEIRKLPSEPDRLRGIDEIVNWTNPGPGGFYDDLGDPNRQPHLVRGAGWHSDPGFYATPQIGFTDRVFEGRPLPRSWWTSAESLYDASIRLHYPDLDKSASYALRVVYGRYKNSAPIRLIANERWEIHSWLQRECQRLEFPIPREATATGELTLTWLPQPGRGENGRVLEVAEVWLIKQ